MGSSPSKQTSEVQIRLNHPKFAVSKIVSDGQNKYLQTNISADDKSYEKWCKDLEQLAANNQFLLTPTKKSFSTKGICGTTGMATINYENYPHLLLEQINSRKQNKKNFQEVEVWYLLYALLKAKKQISKYYSKVGDIRPQNIFLNQKAQVKVSHIISWPSQNTNFQKCFQNEITYIAPEEMRMLATGTNSIDDHYQSQLFSIGLTVLATGLLTDASYLYNLKTHKFDVIAAKSIFNQWINTKYSEILKAVVLNLCDIDQSKRASVDQVTNWIEKYSQAIRKRQDFTINEAPKKIHETVKTIRELYISNPNLNNNKNLPNNPNFNIHSNNLIRPLSMGGSIPNTQPTLLQGHNLYHTANRPPSVKLNPQNPTVIGIGSSIGGQQRLSNQKKIIPLLSNKAIGDRPNEKNEKKELDRLNNKNQSPNTKNK